MGRVSGVWEGLGGVWEGLGGEWERLRSGVGVNMIKIHCSHEILSKLIKILH